MRVVHSIEHPPYAGDHDAVSELIEKATLKGYRAVELGEGGYEPNSIFVFDKSALRSQ